MSAPRAVAELVVDSIRIFGKAMAAAGRQAARNARHKPEGNGDSPSASGSSKSITSQMQMSLDEAHLILNVKKEEPMEKVLESYERIFKANGPPPAPKEPPATPGAGGQAQVQNARQRSKAKGPTHSHYLQSKVYRALERIKAERAEEIQALKGEAAEGAAKEGEAAEVKQELSKEAEGISKEGETFAPPPPKQ